MRNAERTILQIIPAAGWRAVYEEDDGSLHEAPVACWALIEKEERPGKVSRDVEGMGGDDYLDFIEDIGNFVRYVGPGQNSDGGWIDHAATAN